MGISPAEAAVFASLFATYREIAEPSDRLKFANQNPALISSEILAVVAKDVQGDPEAKRDGRLQRLVELEVICNGIGQAVSRFKAGLGPIEVEAARVANKETSLKAALAHVRRPEIIVQLAPVYVHALTWHAERLATDGGDAGTAMRWSRLLAEACLATCPGQSINKKLVMAATTFIQVAGIALGSIPDGEMLHAAEALGKDLVDRLASDKPDPRRGAMLHALGVLFSDPVTGLGGWGIHEINRRQQLRKLELEKGPALARQHQQNYPLPSAKDALQTAVGYFERALPDRNGEERGVTLKAIAQTLEFLARCNDEEVDRPRLAKLCTEALPLLPAGDQHRALVMMMARLGVEGAPAPEADFAPDSPEAVLQLQAVLKTSDPARALNVLVDAAALFRNTATEMLRQKRLQAMEVLIPLAHGGALTVPIVGSFKDALDRALKTADAEHWPMDRLCATLFWLATVSERSDDEETGLRLLKVALEKSATIAAYQESAAFLHANLSVGVAKNAVKAGHFNDAVASYARALAPMLRLGMPSVVFDLLEGIGDAAGKPGEDMMFAVLSAIAPVAFEIDRELGAAGDEALEAVYQNSFANLGDSINSATVAMLLQLAKGARFSAMLRQGSTVDWRGDKEAVQLSAEIAGLQKEIGLDYELKPMDEVLLVSPSGAGDAQSGDTRKGRLANLQRSLDSRLTDLIIKGVRSNAILDPEAIGQLLGPKTVLLDYYFGAHDEKQNAVYILAYTREEIQCFKNLVPGDKGQYLAGAEGSQVVLDDIGIRTYRLRHSLPLDPDNPAVELLHADARESLKGDFQVLLGTKTWNHLETLRKAGKTHLCIRPYGALRYYPLHLLGPEDQDLAQHWTVTTIPSLECLMQPAPTPRPSTVQALGLSYKNGKPFPLVELKSARREVNAIAAASKTDPLLDASVTEEKIFAALNSNRWVHLCAHGANNATSPLFQHLFVTPDAESDGRICAYEIIGHNLRGLELLSLGSCDSALGRFDAGDNLSGLPASLLAAGVSSIVASLWELSDDAAATFFPRLYSELAGGATRLEAFRQAQIAVRTAFPQPRDWAAFCYIGAWSHPDASLAFYREGLRDLDP